ncbi:MAG: phage tail sheath subtilisin-like domain-containing protein [Gammaproteobacteria bacterium]|nr:phage tail sheath subtilisin-like domain-containing protein [Gammaproteobacteria bacterium]NNJ83486.1 phage tail protein [Gammaproteobacteria bacterium]
MSFLHGVEIIELDGGPRPIQTPKASVIGLVGTAAQGPVNKPVLIEGSRKKAVETFGEPDGTNTIPDALDAIFDQTGALIVVVNVGSGSGYAAESVSSEEKTFASGVIVLSGQEISNLVVTNADGSITYEEGADYTFDAATGTISRAAEGALASGDSVKLSYDHKVVAAAITKTDIEGKIDADTGQYTGILALLGAQSEVAVTPRLLIAPSFTHEKTVVDTLIGVAERLRAVVIADGPNTTNEAAKAYRAQFGSARVYMVDPGVMIDDVTQVASPRVVGAIVKRDNQHGFWWSPSNQPILGITGTVRPIDFALGDQNAAANLLNEQEVATIINQDGYRLWGNRTCSSDSKWAFISVRRTADMLNDALLQAHLWAVDRNITKTYVEDVIAGVNNYLNSLKSKGAIIGGACWADPDLNTPDQIVDGKITFDFDFTPPYPAEHITFRSSLVNNYLTEIF